MPSIESEKLHYFAFFKNIFEKHKRHCLILNGIYKGSAK